MAMVAEGAEGPPKNPKKRKYNERVKYLDMEVPEDKKERRAALQRRYEEERHLVLIQDKFSYFWQLYTSWILLVGLVWFGRFW